MLNSQQNPSTYLYFYIYTSISHIICTTKKYSTIKNKLLSEISNNKCHYEMVKYIILELGHHNCSSGCNVNKYRFQLYAYDKEKFKAKSVGGIKPKFEMMEILETDKELDNTYNVTMRIKTLKNNLIHFDLNKPFKLVIFGDAGIVTDWVDILEDHYNITREIVQSWVHYFRLYGNDTLLEDLKWYQVYLASSCDKYPQDKFIDKFIVVTGLYMVGLTYFNIMLYIMNSTSE